MQPMLERLVGEDVEVSVALDGGSVSVYADQHQLEQVIMNLAVNARDAMPFGGSLLIETAAVQLDEAYIRLHPTAQVGKCVMLAISDTGVGIDEETQQRIFEPFFTTKPAGQGTGLGLAMVQGIVAQSGGHIEVSSEPGQGTTFRIYLPARAEAATGGAKPAAVPTLGGNETILIVEDVAEVRGYAADVLRALGYLVLEAESSEKALRICGLEPGPIHLLLTDVVMPNVNGRELADRLEDLRPGIKVLFMSGYTDNALAAKGVLDEGVHFIEKPFGAEALARKIRGVLGPPSSGAHDCEE
jgi:CheY-like chemotaxis protein